ncbi:MAG: hypothetical protein CMK24_00730 [Porticoccaceae bacterium]|nr:hypothetical protein [Porticoccaceae bacterium]
MNILQVQDDLKNFSQQQLIQEMKQPKGVAPQFLVLGEITRRKRMSDDMKTRGAADQRTVAQEVVSAAGVPQGGLAQMSQAMAPKSSIEPNVQPPSQAQPQAPMPMASGGILSLAVGGKPKKGETFFLEFPNNSPILAGERREVTANTLEKLKSEMPVFFKRMLKRGEVLSSEDASEAYKKTATKLVPLQLNFAVRKAKENIAQAEEAAKIAELQAETGATDDQAVTSAGSPTESQVIDEVQSLDAPVAEPSEYDIQQDSDIEGDLLMADDYEKAVSDRLAQDNIRRRQEAEIARKQSSIDAQTVPDAVIPTGTSGPPSSGFASPLQQAQNEKAFQEKIAFDARSDEAAAISAELREKQEAAVRKAQENARAYAEGRTPKQEEQREFDRQNARDSAITALGQIDRSNEPVGFRQIMENKALQQAAIAQANPNMFGDLGAPNTMQEELARKAAEDEAAKEAQAEAQLQSYLRNMEAPTDMIGGIRESDLVREMRTSNEMANQAKIDQILSGGSQGMDFNANLASPELDENVARAIINRQRREAAERVALKDATGQSIESAAPIGNYGQVAADALRADVGVRDAGLGGAFAKGDDGTEQGFFFDDPSTSEIIQRQLDRNKAADERQKRNDDLMITGESSGYGDEDQRLANEQAKFSIVDPYAADRAAIASSDTILNDDVQNDTAYLDNRIEGAKAVLAGGGNIYTPGRNPPFQSYNLQTYEESPSVTMPYYEKPTMRETGEYGPMIGGIRGRASTIKQGRAEGKALIDDPRMFGDDGEPKNYFFDDIPGSSYFSDAFNKRIAEAQKIQEGTLGKRLGPTLQASEDMRKAASRPLYNYLGMDLDDAPSRPYTFGDTEIKPDLTQGGVLSTNPAKVAAEFVADNARPVAEVIGDVAAAGAGYGPNYFSGPSSADGSAGEGTEVEAVKAATTVPVNEAGGSPQQEMDAGTSESSIITEIDEQAALDAQSSAAYEAERQRKIAAQSKGKSKGTGGAGSSASSQILDLLKSQEANADSDKWLALANAGMALMSSKQPTLGGALGEAGQVGIAGLMKSRQAGDAAKLKTLKFQAGLEAAAAKAGLPKDRTKSYVSIYNNLQDNITSLLKETGSGSIEDLAMGTSGSGISEAQRTRAVNLIRKAQQLEGALGISFGNSGVFNATK